MSTQRDLQDELEQAIKGYLEYLESIDPADIAIGLPINELLRELQAKAEDNEGLRDGLIEVLSVYSS